MTLANYLSKITLVSFVLFLLASNDLHSQEVEVTTLVPEILAAGGITKDAQGNIYVSNFGPFTTIDSNAVVYKIDRHDLSISVFCDGFIGASGSCFDSQGNFYQANNNGNRISKIHPDGTKEYDWATGLSLPVGVIADSEDNIFACNCSGNTISKITADGTVSTFAESDLFKCPNGLTIDGDDNLYACNFSDGKVLKISTDGSVSEFVTMPVLSGGPNPVGNGHLTYDKGYLYITLIGLGQVYRICVDDQEVEFIAGVAPGFSNVDGAISVATFSRPNGIIMSNSGDTLFVNCSEKTWLDGPEYQPNLIRMITGLNSLPTDACASDPVSTDDLLPGLTFFEISPSPVTDQTVSIKFELEGVDSLQILLYDINGQLLQKHTSMNLGWFEMSVPGLSAGMYVVKLKTESGSMSKKFVVK